MPHGRLWAGLRVGGVQAAAVAVLPHPHRDRVGLFCCSGARVRARLRRHRVLPHGPCRSRRGGRASLCVFRTLYPAVDLLVLGHGDVLARLGRLFDEQLRLAVQRRFRRAAPRTVSQISHDPAHRLEGGPRGQLRQLLFCPFHGSLCVRGFLHSGLRDREVDGGARDPVLVLDAVVRGGRVGAGQQFSGQLGIPGRDGLVQAREQSPRSDRQLFHGARAKLTRHPTTPRGDQ